MALCETFRYLSSCTWNKIGQGRNISFQWKEETVTDNLLFFLKKNHSQEIITKTFTKRKESDSGADWEWWLTGQTRRWLGIRIQAKIIDIETNCYEQLHYKNGSQTRNLIDHCSSKRIIPLYCLYSHWDETQSQYHYQWRCGTFRENICDLGCSVTGAKTVDKLGSKKHLTDLLSHIIPWHCLVCCRGFGGDDLPTRVNNTVKSLLEGEGGAGGELYYEQNIPQYVQQLISNGLSEPPDDDLRTITIIRENS